jgi:hypothetical protein
MLIVVNELREKYPDNAGFTGGTHHARYAVILWQRKRRAGVTMDDYCKIDLVGRELVRV